MRKLTTRQQTIVDFPLASDLLILAGPGSGKTETLSQRIARAATEQRDRIVAITFTNAAAGELRHRLHRAGIDVGRIFVGTLHSFALTECRKRGNRLSFMRDGFSFLSNIAIDSIIDDAIEANKAKSKVTKEFRRLIPEMDPFDVLCRIPGRKEDVVARAVWNEFKRINGWPFSVVLHELVQFAGEIECRLFVDEVQDSSWLDGQIYDRLRGPKTFVGDPRQGIYGFRGGSTAFIEGLGQKVSVTTVNLNETFRFGRDICETANDISKGSPKFAQLKPIEPAIVSDVPPGDLMIENHQTPTAEINEVIKRLKAVPAGESAAVLLRTNPLVSEYGAEIKVQITDGRSVFVRGTSTDPKIVAEAAWLSQFAGFVLNPTSEASAFALVASLEGRETAARQLRACRGRTPLATTLAQQWRLKDPPGSVIELAKVLVRHSRHVQAETIMAVAQNVGPGLPADALLPGLMEALSIEQGTGDIHVETMHSAKGREFDHVFIPAQQDRKDTVRGDDQERALFYVAVTRARKSVYVSCAMNRKKWEKGPLEPAAPSPFLLELVAAMKKGNQCQNQ